MTPFGVVRLPAFHIGKQGVSGLIHSVFGFLYFWGPRHDPDSTTLKSKGPEALRPRPGKSCSNPSVILRNPFNQSRKPLDFFPRQPLARSLGASRCDRVSAPAFTAMDIPASHHAFRRIHHSQVASPF